MHFAITSKNSGFSFMPEQKTNAPRVSRLTIVWRTKYRYPVLNGDIPIC